MLTGDNSPLPSAPVARVPSVDLERAVAGLDNEPGFVDLRDQDTLPLAQANIRVKGRAGSQFVLQVNGAAVSDRLVGKRVVIKDRQLEAWEFIGVELRPGANTLTLLQRDGFGNERGRQTITVVAPGKLGRLRLRLPADDARADGVTPVVVSVELTDAQGVPVTARTPVTIESSNGRWNVADLNPKEDGIQQFIENGRAQFELWPPDVPGDATIVVSSGALEDRGVVSFLPELRPLLAVGVVEGRIHFRSLDLANLQVARQDDGFEEELRAWSFDGGSGHTQGGARGAFFLKGKIKGDYLLTMAYDSDKDTKERLFRDIQPDEFYPVYGDSSVRGFDAQSTSRLYVRVDKKKCYALYGDFTTGSTHEARGLGNYSRSLTGAKTHLENRWLNLNAWATRDSTTQKIEEFRADGTSGPYFLSKQDWLENSEKVELIVRDRNQTAVILSVTPLSRFADYEFEPFSGRLLFRAPVPSLDANLNPVYIRVTFEVDQGGDKFWVYGADGQVRVHPRWEIGGATVFDENPENRYELHSVNTTVKLTDKTFLIGEVARSESDERGQGDAGRVELRHTSEWTDLRAYYANVQTNFDNSASVITAGREEAGLKVAQRLSKRDRVLAHGIYTKDRTDESERKGILASLEHTFDTKIRAEVGGRYSRDDDEAVDEIVSVRGKLTTPLPYAPNASVYGEYENDLNDTDRRVIAAGVDYQLADRSRFYARHEFISSLGSAFELNGTDEKNTTVVGVETAYMKDGNLFNEYRLRDGITGREGEAAIGLRNNWAVAEGVRLSGTYERVAPIAGTNETERATAITGGLEYTRHPDWRGTARLEFRDAETNDRYLSTLGYARKLNREWTGLAKAIVLYTDSETDTTGDLFQSRLQLGAAYRPVWTDKWNALAKYEYKYEDDETTRGDEFERNVHIISIHANWQCTAKLVLSTRYAGKLVFENDSYGEADSITHLVSGRVSYDVWKRLNVAVNWSALIDHKSGAVQYGVGPEVGYLVGDNVWVGVGYNLLGFHDKDLSEGNYTDHGVFIALRMQFDEHLLDGLKRGGRQ